MDIEGLGGETVELLFKEGLIDDYADLYTLTKEAILPLERMAEKSAENLIKGVADSVNVPGIVRAWDSLCWGDGGKETGKGL